MKIAFDYQVFAAQKYGGSSRYFTSLARELSLMGERPRIIAPVHCSGHLPELSPDIVTGWRWERYLPPKSHHVQRAINVLMTRVLMSTWRPHIVHETYYSRVRSGPRETPTVITVFDMIHELFPEQFPANDKTTDLKREAVRRADHVICISANTRDDLIRLFDCPRDRLSVIHLAADYTPHMDGIRSVSHADVNGPFILYVGVRRGYKNFARLLAAFAASPSLRKDFKILAFGGGNLSPEEITMIEQLGLTGLVVHYSGEDTFLDLLYRRAFALVYPSMYEGFGLPPLEAMARGCPVIASNAGSMPEVIGDAGELFDAADIGAMAKAIEAVAYSDGYRRTLIDRGIVRAKHFSWRRCAEETLAVYRTLAVE
jgi:glycosyltransferase involved in cell wall biosynthesis